MVSTQDSSSAGRAEPRGTERRVGLTRERIVDAALGLSEGVGLNSWTIRDLAGELDVAPSVIYHHLGGRDVVLRGVVERLTGQVVIPDRGLPWDEWFRDFLTQLRPLLVRYPGAAKWLVMHGPAFPGVAAAFDAGIGALATAGFPNPAMTYALLVNTAMLTISMTDDRIEAGDDGPRDHVAMRREFSELGAESPGITRLLSEMLDPLADEQRAADAGVGHAYYGLLVSTLIAGLAAQLPAAD